MYQQICAKKSCGQILNTRKIKHSINMHEICADPYKLKKRSDKNGSRRNKL